jgi:hypothetical protein
MGNKAKKLFVGLSMNNDDKDSSKDEPDEVDIIEI